MVMKKTYDPYENAIDIRKDKKYSTNIFLSNLFKSFNLTDLVIVSIVFIICLIFSYFIINSDSNIFDLITGISGNLLSYFSITIGFSFAAMVFIVDNMEKYSSNKINTMNKIMTLIITYIAHGLIMIGSLVAHYFLGSFVFLSDILLCVINFIVLSFLIYMTFLNLFLFFKIIKLLYYFSYTTINKNSV